MLLQFSVENFMSFKEKKVLSLVPSSDRELPDNIAVQGSHAGLKTVLIYGANASGKTCLFKAITTALNTIRWSAGMQINDKIPVVPFRFDSKSAEEPSSFEFTFIAGDEKKYIYGFKATSVRVHEEYLYCYNTNRPAKLFDRVMDEYSYSRTVRQSLQQFEKMNTANKLFIATATAWNSEVTKIPFNWLSQYINSFTDVIHFANVAMGMYTSDAVTGKNDNIIFTEKLMKQADLNISSINIDVQKMKDERGTNIIQVITGHSNSHTLSLSEESMGTQKLFYYGPILKDVMDRGKTLVVDEIDSSLHPFIVRMLIDLFMDKKINVNGAQLIATTHDTSQLSLRRLRRDQIYFAEKDNDTGVSDLYSLDDFDSPVRKTDNAEKNYLLGRYGAIPYVHSEDLF